MQFRELAFVQKAHDEHVAARFSPEEDYVTAFLVAQVAGPQRVNAAQRRILGQALASVLKRVEVQSALLRAPPFRCVLSDLDEVSFRSSREANLRHD